MGRRGRELTVAAILVAAGLAVALVVVLPDGDDQESLMIGGEGSGTVTVEPALVEPRVPGTTFTPSTPDPSNVPSHVASDRADHGAVAPVGEIPNDAGSGRLGVRVGSAGGLYPGHRVELGVTYMNPYSFPIAIDKVHLTATGTTRCTAQHLTHPPMPFLRLPAGSSVASTIRVGMRKSAPDACQGVRFEVRVNVTAVPL